MRNDGIYFLFIFYFMGHFFLAHPVYRKSVCYYGYRNMFFKYSTTVQRYFPTVPYGSATHIGLYLLFHA